MKIYINIIHIQKQEKSQSIIGPAWGTDYVAERLRSDLHGEERKIDGKLYNKEGKLYDYGLLKYLVNNKFKEYIIEVGTTYDIGNYEDEFGGNTQENSSKNTTKLEIIYVEYVEQE